MDISEEGVRWLLQAGRLIQAKGQNKLFRKITKIDGESYPEAVLREVHAMPVDLQSDLFDTVDWAMECTS